MRSSARALILCASLISLAYSQPARAITACGSDKPLLDAGGLCYTGCKPGYQGVGPVCYRENRSSACDPGSEKSGALCYPKCKDGYSGVGPVCWQSCPSGYTDDGAYCRKPADYGRGAGYPWKGGDKAFSLSGAKKRCEKDHGTCEKNGAIYYPTCKAGFEAKGCCICQFKSCPSGMTDIGISCQKGSYGRTAGRDANSYARGVGVVPKSCTSSDISKACDSSTTTTPFVMLFASDPQLVWYSTAGCSNNAPCVLPYGDCSNDDCKAANAFKTNENQFAGINSVDQLAWPPTSGSAHQSPVGLIVNGDLTSYYHPDEEEWMEHYLRSSRWDVYPGLGNHDYENNWKSCSGETADTQHCLTRALAFMRSSVSCGHLSKLPAAKIHDYDQKSMAYSWDQGSYHFVQLHNRPDYPTSSDTASGTSLFGPSINWLKKDLAAATKSGKQIVLNMHDLASEYGDANFIAALQGTNLRAVFAGHIHNLFGRQADITVDGRQVPTFYSGSSLFMTFLMAEFGPHSIKVAVIDSSSGKAQYKKDSTGAPIVSDVSF